MTCGDPVCGGHRDNPEVAPCTDESAGATCGAAGDQCDPINDCNSYLYRHESPQAPRHLGFIIEDVGRESVCVDGARDMVDLYGTLSMAIATIQVQDARIGELEARLEALERAAAAR